FAHAQDRLVGALVRRPALATIPLAIAVAAGAFATWRGGREFFPVTDAGLLRLFVRLPSGERVEDTAWRFAEIHRAIRETIPANELGFVVENIGAPNPVNQAWIETTAVTPADGEFLVQLRPGH